MIIVHDTFNCKPGNATKIAAMFKEWIGKEKEVLHIMTDMTGQWHRVVMVSQYENLSAYEKNWEKYMADTQENRKMNEKMNDLNDMYVSGNREIFKVE